ncbi:hypothetical protein IWZ00DRAFT_268307 [Phyllosticta capitalensis]
MEISSLIPMVSGQPNEQFLRLIGKGSKDLKQLATRWDNATTEGVLLVLKIYSFYETKESLIAVKVDGQWKMIGPSIVLVNRDSATHGKSGMTSDKSHFVIPIDSTHSNMVKFMSINDGVYRDNIVPWLRNLSEERWTKALDLTIHLIDNVWAKE